MKDFSELEYAAWSGPGDLVVPAAEGSTSEIDGGEDWLALEEFLDQEIPVEAGPDQTDSV